MAVLTISTIPLILASLTLSLKNTLFKVWVVQGQVLGRWLYERKDWTSKIDISKKIVIELIIYRGKFHLLPQLVGWNSNGFVYYKNEYHLFINFTHIDSVWGPMHWGHAKSKDLDSLGGINSFGPSEVYDRNGCSSGSAIVIDDKLVLIYTGHVEAAENVMHRDPMYGRFTWWYSFWACRGNPVIGEKAYKRELQILRIFVIRKLWNTTTTIIQLSLLKQRTIGDKSFCLSLIIASIGVLNQYY